MISVLEYGLQERADPKEFFEDLIGNIDPGLKNLLEFSISRTNSCNVCTTRHTIDDEIMDFIAVSTKAQNVQDAVDEYFLPETVDDYQCPNCSYQEVIMEKVISYHPQVLLVHNTDGKAKILNAEIIMGDRKYDLVGFNVMKGSTQAGRHYTSVRAFQGVPLEFDDHIVHPFKNRSLKRKLRFYMALYVRDDSGQPIQKPTSSHASESQGPFSDEGEISGSPKSVHSSEKPPKVSYEGKGKGKGKKSKPKKEPDVKDDKMSEHDFVEKEPPKAPSILDPTPMPTQDENQQGIPQQEKNPNATSSEGLPKKSSQPEKHEEEVIDLDDTIEYEVRFDEFDNPIIIEKQRKETVENVEEEANKVKSHQDIIEKFKDTIKTATVTLMRQSVQKMKKNLKTYVKHQKEKSQEEKKQEERQQKRYELYKKKEQKRKEQEKKKASSTSKSTTKVDRKKDNVSSERKFRPRKTQTSRKIFHTKDPDQKRIGSKKKEEDAYTKIKSLVRKQKQQKLKFPTGQERKEYTKRQWDTTGLKQGRKHKSFLSRSASSVFPSQQRIAKNMELDCILCGGRKFFAATPEEMLDHYHGVHYNRVLYFRDLMLLMCKCHEVVTRTSTNRNSHHHCPVCWRPCDKTKDIKKHINFKHGIDQKEIAEK